MINTHITKKEKKRRKAIQPVKEIYLITWMRENYQLKEEKQTFPNI